MSASLSVKWEKCLFAGLRLGLNEVKAAGTQDTIVSSLPLLAYPRLQPTLPTSKLLLPLRTSEKEARKSGFQVTLDTRVLAPGTTDPTEEQG